MHFVARETGFWHMWVLLVNLTRSCNIGFLVIFARIEATKLYGKNTKKNWIALRVHNHIHHHQLIWNPVDIFFSPAPSNVLFEGTKKKGKKSKFDRASPSLSLLTSRVVLFTVCCHRHGKRLLLMNLNAIRWRRWKIKTQFRIKILKLLAAELHRLKAMREWAWRRTHCKRRATCQAKNKKSSFFPSLLFVFIDVTLFNEIISFPPPPSCLRLH